MCSLQHHRGTHLLPARAPVSSSPTRVQRRRAARRLLLRGFCSKSGPPASAAGEEESGDRRVLVVERYKDGSCKRYILDKNLHLQALSESGPLPKERNKLHTSHRLSFLPEIVLDFILPAGYPGSVSDDYLEYMLLQFPTNITGWVCHTLVTSSLLKAVGVGSFSGTTVAASAAVIRWVSKDGLGAVGRLIIGGRFGKIFDDDPKQWRMYADIVGSTGSIFELLTQAYPEYFLLLASLGNFGKAIAKGFKDPSFRVIQNHFAAAENLGDVAAKEEVWEVVAQLFGLALGIFILDAPGLQMSYSGLAFIWFAIRLLHLWLRYQSLSVLRFPTINLKRAKILANSHVKQSIVPGYVACNEAEDILSWDCFFRPQLVLGASLNRVLHLKSFGAEAEKLLKLYSNEKYILVLDDAEPGELKYLISFKVGATSMVVMRSLWQACWLDRHYHRMSLSLFDLLEESLHQLQDGFNDFINKLEIAGWSRDSVILRVPTELVLEEADI